MPPTDRLPKLPFRSWGFRPQVVCLLNCGLIVGVFALAVIVARNFPDLDRRWHFTLRACRGAMWAGLANAILAAVGLVISRRNPHGDRERLVVVVCVVVWYGFGNMWLISQIE